LLNVSDTPTVLGAEAGRFREVAWHPIADRARIPEDRALECLTTLHRMVCQDGARVYVHCVAGWRRSPTVIWLYLIACGMSPSQARVLIASRAAEATIGDAGLVDGPLIDTVIAFGAAHCMPHPRPEGLRPA
jgi:hypothetical protein